jgi:uncharacterized protein YdeI (YjbR/CyaY-like superfamily)
MSKSNVYALAYRIRAMKTPAAREAKIERFVAMVARGETIHPQKSKKERRAKHVE